jgi:hypothetical protein
MVIKADEAENCNLLEVLEHALKFMQDGLKHGKVLVHWYYPITFILFNECTLKESKQLTDDGLQHAGRVSSSCSRCARLPAIACGMRLS